jgi:hypothetical protein
LDLIESGVRAHFSGPVNFSVAYLDYQRLGQEAYRESLAATLRLGYGCGSILALAQRTLLFPMLYLLMEVLRIGEGFVLKADALDDLHIL